MAERIWSIQRCNLFEQLTAGDLAFLEERARMRVFARNSSVYFPSDAAESVYVLVEGRIRLYSVTRDGKEAILALIEPGELFGELALSGNTCREEFASSVSISRVVSIPREAIEAVMMRSPGLSLAITKFVGLRRRTLERRLRNLLFRSSRERLIELLCELVENYGRSISEGILIDIKLSHQDLAGLIGITRESVTLLLGDLQTERLIQVGRQRIVIVNQDKLFALSSDYLFRCRVAETQLPPISVIPKLQMGE